MWLLNAGRNKGPQYSEAGVSTYHLKILQFFSIGIFVFIEAYSHPAVFISIIWRLLDSTHLLKNSYNVSPEFNLTIQLLSEQESKCLRNITRNVSLKSFYNNGVLISQDRLYLKQPGIYLKTKKIFQIMSISY